MAQVAPEMAYVAMRRVKISGRYYEPGEVVPSEHLQGGGSAYLIRGKYINEVPKSTLVEAADESAAPADPFAGMNAKDSIEVASAQMEPEMLENMLDFEQKREEYTGKASRSSVVKAIESRMAELEEEREQKLRDSAPDPNSFETEDDLKKWLDTVEPSEGSFTVVDEVLAREQNTDEAGQDREEFVALLDAKLDEIETANEAAKNEGDPDVG